MKKKTQEKKTLKIKNNGFNVQLIYSLIYNSFNHQI